MRGRSSIWSLANNTVILHDAIAQQWLLFQTPLHVIEADRLDQVLPALRQVENQVNEHRQYAAGFISYEAASAFEPAIRTHPPTGFPLLWFGLYQPPQFIQLSPPLDSTDGMMDWKPSPSRTDYDQAIAAIKTQIARANTYQVNYTLRLRAPFVGDAWNLFLKLNRAQQAQYAAYVDTGRYAICSASPELFFRLDGDRLTSRPMKGTAGRGRTLVEDESQAQWLLHSEKNRAENVMIVDMIRNDLGRIAEIGSVQVPSLFNVERYPTVWQMTSTVTATTQRSVAEIMTAMFPCASITGAPKIRTTHIIADLETTPRRIYTGCIGFIAPGRTAQFNVAIRTVLIDRENNQAEYGVGGGIVWDSTEEEEYAECLTKARLLNVMRPDFSLLEALLWSPETGYFLLDDHIRRLSDSAVYFSFPLDRDDVLEKLSGMAASLPNEAHKVQLLVALDGKISCQAMPLTAIPKPPLARLRLSPTPVDSSNIFLYHKTTYRQVYETARTDCPDCDDVLLWNEHGEITESDTANIVVELDGELLTPPVSCGLLGGTFRRWLLDQGDIQERVISVNDLPRCSKILLINSVRKWREVIWVP